MSRPAKARKPPPYVCPLAHNCYAGKDPLDDDKPVRMVECTTCGGTGGVVDAGGFCDIGVEDDCIDCHGFGEHACDCVDDSEGVT